MESIKPSGEYFKYIDIDAIDNLNHKVKTPKSVSVDNAPSRASRKVHSGDVIFSMVRPYLGNIAYIDNELADCIASTGFYVCTPNKEILFPMYCYYLMISTYVIDGLTQYMKGDNSPSITNDNILDWVFPIPPLSEQKKIAIKIKTLISSINIIEESLQ